MVVSARHLPAMFGSSTEYSGTTLGLSSIQDLEVLAQDRRGKAWEGGRQALKFLGL